MRVQVKVLDEHCVIKGHYAYKLKYHMAIRKIKSSFQNTFVKTVDTFVSVDNTQFEFTSEDNDMNTSDVINSCCG